MRAMRILILLMLLLPSSWLGAQEPEPIVIYVNDQKPWGYRENGELKGASVTFSQLLSKTIDHPIHVEMAPYHRLLKDFEAGRMDFTMFLEDQKPRSAIPVAKLLDVDIVAVGLQGFKIATPADLNGLRVGKMRGAMYSQKLADNTNFHCVEVNNYQQAIQLLLKGRLDAVLGTPMALRYAAQEMALPGDVLGAPFILDSKEAWLYASATSQHRDKIKPIKNAIELYTKNRILQKLASTIMQWIKE